MAKVGPYVMTDTLGVGAFGKVKRGRHIQTGLEVAVKIMDKGDIAANDFSNNVKREIFIMRTLNHRNIVNLHEVLSSKTKLYLVMDLVRGGELFTMIEKQGELDEVTARSFFQQLVDGLAYCHTKGVCHRDLKPENLLIDENNVLKITDFGVSSMREAGSSEQLLQTSCGTPYYVAPEVLFSSKRGGYDGEKADAWSCGVILFLLLSGELPFMNEDMNKLYEEIKTAKIKYPKEIRGDAKTLCQKLLERDPVKRMSLEQVKQQKWFLIDYERNQMMLSRFDKPSVKSPERLSNTPSTKGLNTISSSVSAVGAVDDEEEGDTTEERKALEMQRPVLSAPKTKKGGIKAFFKIKPSPGGGVPMTPRQGDKVSRTSSFEEFHMEASPSSGSIRPASSQRDNISMRSNNSRENIGSPTASMPRPRSSHRGSQISIEGAEDIVEGARDLRDKYRGKDMREFITDALPGKPDKKIDEVVDKLSDVDVDCVDDLQVMVETCDDPDKFQEWLTGKPGLPEVTAVRIRKMFFP
mmetsp:Transcript_9990/g.17992  ORF Transcript_9990/g.17992 Transcript_9990/m.17992 type:complete len:524 (-) Transcript_9990:316-1887(-)